MGIIHIPRQSHLDIQKRFLTINHNSNHNFVAFSFVIVIVYI
jgi:hypothetical protein